MSKYRRGAISVILSLFVLLPACGEMQVYEPPESPFPLLGRLDLPSANEGVGVMGSYAYVAGGQAGLHVVDLTNPAAPVLVGTTNTTKYAEAVCCLRLFNNQTLIDVALVVEGTEGITSYNITDPNDVGDFNQGSTAIDGNGLFILEPDDPDQFFIGFLAESWKGLRVFRSIPDEPGVLIYPGFFTNTLGYAMGVYVRDGYAYVADDEMGLTVVDVGDVIQYPMPQTATLEVVANADTPGNALGVTLDGDYAYVADGTEGLAVFLIDGGETPIPVANLDLPAYSRAIEYRDGYVFLAAATGGVHVVDVGDPSDPVYAGNVPSSYASGLCVSPDGLVLVSDQEDGLLVLGGGAPFTDLTPPGPLASPGATPVNFTTIDLTWYAPGDDGFKDRATAYDLRYASSAIDDNDAWEAATTVEGLAAPGEPGTLETLTLTGLSPGEERHFAGRVEDEAGNVSSLSASFSATTYEGSVLLNSGVNSGSGSGEFVFAFEATWLDEDDLPPTEAAVVIDGEVRAMSLVEGSPYTGSLYRYETMLDLGDHNHYFHFLSADGETLDTEVAEGPFVVADIVFDMGSPSDEYGRDDDEVLHSASLRDTVLASAHEVTQAEWVALGFANQSQYPGDTLPVHNVSWYDAVAYCNALSAADGFTEAYAINGNDITWDRQADGWRLPTEAEWEWLCRADTETAFFGGDITDLGCGLDPVLDEYGWYCGNTSLDTVTTCPQPVGGKAPNSRGLYDMHGNVWEWCWDWYGAYDEGSVLDPTGPDTGSQKVVRGGSWFYFSRDCRSASRGEFWPESADDTIGFRVVRTIFSE